MRTSKPALHSNDKEGMLRAMTDEWKEVELVYDVKLEMAVEPTGRKGVLRLSVSAYRAGEGHTGLVQSNYQCEYPTASVETFEACLYRCMIKVERILRDKFAYPMGKA